MDTDQPSAVRPAAAAPLAALPPTERRNPASLELDRLDTRAILELINDQDATVPAVVRGALPELTELTELALRTLRAGGRVHYFGAGTGGRLALGDAVELGPTYGVGTEQVVGHLAGGARAGAVAREDAEDHAPDPDEPHPPVRGDLVIGVTASGRTPTSSARCARPAPWARRPPCSPRTRTRRPPTSPTCTCCWTPGPKWSPARPG